MKPSNIVIPPLHTLLGCVNTMLKAMWLTDKNGLNALFKEVNVKATHQSSSLLNGRDCRKFLKYILKEEVTFFNNIFQKLIIFSFLFNIFI